MRWVSLVLVCVSIAFSGSRTGLAASDDVSAIPDWTVRPNFSPKEKNQKERTLDRCSAQLTNADRITIIYSLDRHYMWTFELSNPSWNFPKGSTFEVAFGSGNRSYFRQRVAALEPQLVRVLLPDSVNSFEAFRRLPRLELVAGGLTSQFDLNYGNLALAALVKCVQRYGTTAKSRAAVAAWLKSPIGPAAGPSADPEIQKEASSLAANIISEADITKATNLKPGEIPPEAASDAAWKVGTNIFTVSILSQGDIPEIGDLTDLIIGGDAQNCRGDFFSGAMLDAIETVNVARAYTNCQTAQTSTAIYYFVAPRKRGGVYLLKTIVSGVEVTPTGEKNSKDLDGRIRASFMAALAKL
jgi:hypothetical protein